MKANNLEILAFQGLSVCRAIQLVQSWSVFPKSWNLAPLKPPRDMPGILQKQAVAKTTYRSLESTSAGGLTTHTEKYLGHAPARLHEINKRLSFWLRSDFSSTITVLSTSSWDSFVWCKSRQQSRSEILEVAPNNPKYLELINIMQRHCFGLLKQLRHTMLALCVS